MGIEAVIVLLLIVANGLLSMSELAIVSARTVRLQQMADQGNDGATVALKLAAEPNRFLSTVQIGITLIGILNGAFGGATLSEPIANALRKVPFLDAWASSIAPILVVLVITYLSLVIGELVPKRLALRNPERMASLMAPVLALLSKLMAPVATFLAASTEVVLRTFGPETGDENQVTEEEIELLLQQGTEAGIFQEAERRLVEGVFDVSERSVGELMTPRHAVDLLDLTRTDDENRETMREHPHNLYPVCDGTPDNIVGYVSTRELWRREISGESTAIPDAIQQALFVPEISSVFTVIDQMRISRQPMAILIDEYGGFDGIITFNDILSDIVGEIDDPARTNLRGAVVRPDGSWLIDGVFPAHELRELLAIDELPGEDAGRFESVGGFLMDQLGHVPKEGETVIWDRFTFEIVDMDGNRIDKILVTPAQEPPPAVD
ncbi:MAG: hemolysin family protein [Thermomicrobiales bacterium]